MIYFLYLRHKYALGVLLSDYLHNQMSMIDPYFTRYKVKNKVEWHSNNLWMAKIIIVVWVYIYSKTIMCCLKRITKALISLICESYWHYIENYEIERKEVNCEDRLQFIMKLCLTYKNNFIKNAEILIFINPITSLNTALNACRRVGV